MANITFLKTTSIEPVGQYIAERLTKQLAAGRRVLWLVPGGSAIAVAVFVSKILASEQLDNLTVGLTDERYGPEAHIDSNWQQLRAAGFSLPGADLQPVLSGKNLELTAQEYSKLLEADLKMADYSLALVGLGADGHILGIKAGSPAVLSSDFAAGYAWTDYDRLTATSRTLEKLSEVVVYAVGQQKWPQLKTLQEELEPSSQPAQLLKKLKKVIIFNDYKGEPV